MTVLKTGIVAGVVALLVVLGYSFFLPRPERPTDAEIKKKVEESLGAIPGTELPGDRSYAGARKVTIRTALNSATSTICAHPAPMGSSTPTFMLVKLNSAYGTTTAGSNGPILEIFQSREDSATTTAFATSTARMIGAPYRTKPNGDALVIFPNATTSGVLPGTFPYASSTSQDWWSYGPPETESNRAGRFDYLVAELTNSAAGDYRGYTPLGYCQSEWLVID